jgi:hypothetical protein
MSIYFLLFWSSLLLVSLAALRWGGGTEKSVAALYLFAALATALVRPSIAMRYREVEVSVFLIDLALLVGLAIVAVRAERWWPVCAAALQMLTILAHIGKAVNPMLWRYGYQLMAVWTAWPTVGLLAFGIWQHRRHARRRVDIWSG